MELKPLQTQLRKLQEQLAERKREQRQVNKSVANLTENIAAVQKRVDDLRSADVIVSEHAILRYCERILGIDIDQIREEILPQVVREQTSVLGPGLYSVQGEKPFKVRIKDNTVITIVVQEDI